MKYGFDRCVVVSLASDTFSLSVGLVFAKMLEITGMWRGVQGPIVPPTLHLI